MAAMLNTVLEKLNLAKAHDDPPKEPDAEEIKELREKFKEAQQEHVFHYYDHLSVADKASLFEQLSKIDPHHVNELADKTLRPAKTEQKEEAPELAPLPGSASASMLDSSKEDLDSWSHQGLELVAENKLAVVLMAGGQGTRLGSSAPKGCYNIGLPSKKTLFQLQGERIEKLQHLAAAKHKKQDVIVPWYIMTSGPTRKPTQDFFEEHNYFGLAKENVVIFEQGTLPCISNEGKILMESKSKVRLLLQDRLHYIGGLTSVCTGRCRP